MNKIIRLISLLLVVFLLLPATAGCKKNLIDANGAYDLSQLTPVVAAEIKQQNGRSVIYHNGKPYHYYAMHNRFDHLTNGSKEYEKYIKIFDKSMKIIKDDGWDAVVLYVSWASIFDGEKYDFSIVEEQYKIAQKYDMKIHWNWFGYDVCGAVGFMPWQTDREKYPSLKNEKGEEVLKSRDKPIPDLSHQIFLDEAYESIQQFCAWLNVNDTDRRTVAIQLENEINPGGQELGWMGQYNNLVNHINNIAKAVKTGPYSMVTYTNVMHGNEGLIFDGYDQVGTMHNLIDQEYLDIVGWDFYVPWPEVPLEMIEYGDNLVSYAEFQPGAYSLPGQLCYGFARGYGFGIYQFQNYINLSQGGYVRASGADMLVRRDGTKVLPKIISDILGGTPELNADEMAAFNKSVKALGELIATQSLDSFAYFNNDMRNNVNLFKKIKNEKITYTYKNTDRKYGGSGLALKANDGNFYVLSSLDASYTFESTIKEVTVGTYKDGKWTETEKVTVTDNTFNTKSGLAYRVVI